ncbi:hypothetical protein N180_03035 [Pedobacter antarcticus 4BY]|uniref:Uncharacterized protein n=2 Tax=Pedobacter antarcticus TaxID=34086 RepID=A0A081PKL5_9SPHI|nr:PD-(D/E)XK nuclease-like domain-containing protein [Pedobacter antarcticus]KEQ31238.1 hypothetical protein N180_03035 [Pedobacter antarcticus 4BY]SFE55931.1 hypothetical protein SAMN03003324_00892 [Pedobacter antarcticus]
MVQDPYFGRSEISNSDLSALQELLHPKPQFGDKEYAYAFGTLLDNLITEPDKVDLFNLTVKYQTYRYTTEDFELAKAMKRAYYKDPFAKMISDAADFQAISTRYNWLMNYNGFDFTLEAGTRCKWDLLVRAWKMGGDIKSTAAETQSQFEAACEHFGYFRSRAWYMDIEGTNKDMLIGISKKNQKIFKIAIDRNAPITDMSRKLYEHGKAQYEELAFKYWLLFDGLKIAS